ncbi:MAG: hypothetical protein JXR97_06720 [Planctomycetes bacterium]|nr:hypothetical protein [Planctomycetota bacterium]
MLGDGAGMNLGVDKQQPNLTCEKDRINPVLLFFAMFSAYSIIVYCIYVDQRLWGFLEQTLSYNFPEPLAHAIISCGFTLLCLITSAVAGRELNRNAKWAAFLAVITTFLLSVTLFGIHRLSPGGLSFSLVTMGACAFVSFAGGEAGYRQRFGRPIKFYNDTPSPVKDPSDIVPYSSAKLKTAVYLTLIFEGISIAVMLAQAVPSVLVLFVMTVASISCTFKLRNSGVNAQLDAYVRRMHDEGNPVILGRTFSERMSAYSQICKEMKESDWPARAVMLFTWLSVILLSAFMIFVAGYFGLYLQDL